MKNVALKNNLAVGSQPPKAGWASNNVGAQSAHTALIEIGFGNCPPPFNDPDY